MLKIAQPYWHSSFYKKFLKKNSYKKNIFKDSDVKTFNSSVREQNIVVSLFGIHGRCFQESCDCWTCNI